MKRKTINIQINYNNILIYINNKYLKYSLLESLNNYKIINKTKFIDDLKEILEKHKINNKLLTDNINIIVDKSYTLDEQQELKNILKELSFNSINIINNIDLIKKQDNDIIINLTKNNIKIYHNEKIFDCNIYFNKHIEILTTYLKEILNDYKINNLKIFGDYPQIQKIIKKLENKIHKEVYIYTHPEVVPLCYFIE